MYTILSNISASLKILNPSLSNCVYNMMHESTLITYFIKLLLKKQSIKKYI